MAIANKNTSGWIHSGRGNVSAKLAKSNSEAISPGATEVAGVAEGVSGSGGSANDSGAKPVYATGESPVHKGRGTGRGSQS